jgi:geranylgeranyl diphosphate synthase type I
MMESTALLDGFFETYLPEIEAALHRAVARADEAHTGELYHMLAYHLGWKGEAADANARGKRLRPLLLLLVTAAAGGNPRSALPAAAAIELIHNFSLIHDDIQDNSELRRGRPTVWKLWGVPQAINAGDAMFTLALRSVLDVDLPSATVLRCAQTLQDACLALTKGQYLDISYEHRVDLTLDDYWPMISGKTAALLAAAAEIGAVCASAEDRICQAYRQFGEALGLAFQAQDDLLGIWGDPAATGKSTASDLLTGKKSLPVLHGLSQKGLFALRWQMGPVAPQDVELLRRQLESEGGRAYTEEQADRLTAEALQALDRAQPQGAAGEALHALARRLLGRDK